MLYSTSIKMTVLVTSEPWKV